MTGILYIISGASGSGKTTLLTDIVLKELVSKTPKYSERPIRKLSDGKTDDPDDDIIHVNDISDSKCDIKYVINGRYYGIDSNEIYRILEKKQDCAVILSDLRIVKELKKKLGKSAVSIYISSNISPDQLNEIHAKRHPFSPDNGQYLKLKSQFSRLSSAISLRAWDKLVACMSELLDDWNEYLPESKSVKIRSEKIRLFHNRYIDNISLFDFVILNYYRKEQLVQQFSNIKYNYAINQQVAKYPPIFFLSAASGAGKGTLMSHINLIGAEKLKILSKYALRNAKLKDKRDGMVALGVDGIFPDCVDWKWSFHKGKSFKGVTYGVSCSEIEENLERGIPQIVVSNIGQIEEAFARFGNHIVPVFLHSTRSSDEVKEYQYTTCGVYDKNKENEKNKCIEEAETRIDGILRVHDSYINNIHRISHVILNTTYEEDMYDQIFSLLDTYIESNMSKST